MIQIWRKCTGSFSEALNSGAHPLHLTRLDRGAVTHAVLVRELALEDIGQDLHVGVAVRREAPARGDAIFIDHAQRAESHEARVVIIRERERVMTVEPAVIRMAALGTGTDLNLHGGHRRSCPDPAQTPVLEQSSPDQSFLVSTSSKNWMTPRKYVT